MSVAAFRQIHVGEYQGETTRFTPSVNGMNGHGEATAGFTGELREAETQQSDLRDDYRGAMGAILMPTHGKTSPIARLNKAEIVSRVVDDKRDSGKTNEEAWARQLDSALRSSLRHAAHDHLVGRETSAFSRYWAKSWYAYGVAVTGIDIATGQAPTMLGALAATTATAVLVRETSIRHTVGESMIAERRLSSTAVSREQWDRYAAAAALYVHSSAYSCKKVT